MSHSVTNSPEYNKKKQFFNQLVTLYGRKPVFEVLNDSALKIYRLHLADSNKNQGIIQDIIQLAEKRNIEILYHNKKELSRISKNSKQDQGVCVDIVCPKHKTIKDYLSETTSSHKKRLIALDNITNPQNLGMIIRSVTAGKIDGLLIPEKGCARIDSLVVKASAGTLFKCPLIHCNNLDSALQQCIEAGAVVYGLSSYGEVSIDQMVDDDFIIYIMGNETEGVSQKISSLCHNNIRIPMCNGVESLNVAVTASLLAFREVLTPNK